MERNSIEWHEREVRYLELNLIPRVHEVEQIRDRLHFYKQQIAEARRKGKLKFDPNRFLVKRKK
jgi:hypothetical protein